MPIRPMFSMSIACIVMAGCTTGDVAPDDDAITEPAPGDEGTVADPPPGEADDADVERPSAREVVAAPPLLGDEGSGDADTPEGRAELTLLVDPATTGSDGQVELRLMNRGEVALWHGWHVGLRRWTGHEWVDAHWPGDDEIPDVLESLLPGDATHPYRRPGDDAGLDPGWYQASWEARWEDDTGHAEPIDLQVRASFEVRSPPSPDELPEWYAEREPMPSCGTFEMDEIALDNVELEEANQCLLEAFESGEPAELQVALMTDEGDPIVEIYRVVAAKELEQMIDARQDDFGGKDFYYAVCTDLTEDRPRGGPTVRPGDCVYDEERTVASDR